MISIYRLATLWQSQDLVDGAPKHPYAFSSVAAKVLFYIFHCGAELLLSLVAVQVNRLEYFVDPVS